MLGLVARLCDKGSHANCVLCLHVCGMFLEIPDLRQHRSSRRSGHQAMPRTPICNLTNTRAPVHDSLSEQGGSQLTPRPSQGPCPASLGAGGEEQILGFSIRHLVFGMSGASHSNGARPFGSSCFRPSFGHLAVCVLIGTWIWTRN